MGKNFSANNVSGKRRESDFYETPYSLTRLLLEKITLKGSILEPACGAGAITKVLTEFGYKNVVSYDKETDFLKETKQFDTIITNPPFSLALDFIIKAKTVCDSFFFLLPLSYLHGKERYDIIYNSSTYRLKEVKVFTRYPLLGDPLREDGKHKTGMLVYAWYQWDRAWMCEPTIDWLDNDPYILKKGD